MAYSIAFPGFMIFSDIIIFALFLFFIPFPKKSHAKWENPKVELIPSVVWEIMDNKYQVAQLEVKNLEELEITNCYATLEELSYIYWARKWKLMPMIPTPLFKRDRIKWIESSDANALHEITIPLKDSRHINLADSLEGFGFNLSRGKLTLEPGPKITLRSEPHPKAYTMRIRVDGRFNGKGMKFYCFKGYLYYEIRKLRTLVKLQQSDGTFKDEIHEQDSGPLWVFEKGDWMKNKKVRKLFGLEDSYDGSGKKKKKSE